MNHASVSRVVASITRSLRRSADARGTGAGHTDLGRRIEERGNLATLEARAYIDHRIEALGTTPAETSKHIERRAQLAAQEAKAYADAATESLGSALRAMSLSVVRLSRRVDQLERSLAALQDDRMARVAGDSASQSGGLSAGHDEIDPRERRAFDDLGSDLRTGGPDRPGTEAGPQNHNARPSSRARASKGRSGK